MVFGYFFMPCVFCALFLCASCSAFFGLFGAFGVFAAFSALSAFSAFLVFSAFSAFSCVFGVFGVVGFGAWKFTFWLRPCPAHFLTACDDGIWVLCYAVCFFAPWLYYNESFRLLIDI